MKGRRAQVRMWVAEHAVGLGVAVSLPVLCETAVVRLGVSGATLTIANSPGTPESGHATNQLGQALADLQLTLGEGPSVQAAGGDGPVLVADLDAVTAQHRWPAFAPLAVQAGAHALFALPMRIGMIQVGVFALHQVEVGHLDIAALTDSLAFAELALNLLLNQQADLADSVSLHDPQLHQATGMIAGQLDVGMDHAFARLRARAFATQRPLTELAADVVARRLRFDSLDEPYPEQTDGGVGDGR